MKKLFYSFLLIIVSFLALSSCNKNNTNDVEDDSKYQVTKEEFQKAINLNECENVKIKGNNKYEGVMFIEKYHNKMKIYSEDNSQIVYRDYEEDDCYQYTYIEKDLLSPDTLFIELVYDIETKTYYGNFSSDSLNCVYSVSYIMKFCNGQLKYLNWTRTYPKDYQDNNVLNIIYEYEYDVVEPFEHN